MSEREAERYLIRFDWDPARAIDLFYTNPLAPETDAERKKRDDNAAKSKQKEEKQKEEKGSEEEGFFKKWMKRGNSNNATSPSKPADTGGGLFGFFTGSSGTSSPTSANTPPVSHAKEKSASPNSNQKRGRKTLTQAYTGKGWKETIFEIYCLMKLADVVPLDVTKYIILFILRDGIWLTDYQYDFDTNGILYWLGTEGGKRSKYEFPGKLQQITCTPKGIFQGSIDQVQFRLIIRLKRF